MGPGLERPAGGVLAHPSPPGSPWAAWLNLSWTLVSLPREMRTALSVLFLLVVSLKVAILRALRVLIQM